MTVGAGHNKRTEQQLLAGALAPFGVACACVLLWALLSIGYPDFILPGPLRVLSAWAESIADGSLLYHSAITIAQAVPGLLVGAALAMAIGYPVAKSPVGARILSPIVVASQGIPLVAVAPLLFIWFGNGYGARLLVCALIVFFPIAVNVIAGIKATPAQLRELFGMLGASPRDTLLKLEIPAALPFVFAGLRTGGTLSMIGALTGEFIVISDRGLGFVINQAYGQYNTPRVMAGILTTVLITLGLYAAVRLCERGVSKRGYLE
jgi:NitT/TauT family transport system permease protein